MDIWVLDQVAARAVGEEFAVETEATDVGFGQTQRGAELGEEAARVGF